MDDVILEKILAVLKQKFSELKIYTIEPTVTDLLRDNVYKLNVDEETYLVPLWHKEMYFEDKQDPTKEILVMCYPNLPDGYSIDDDNNLIVNVQIPFDISILEKECITIEIDNIISIANNLVAMKRYQTIIMHGKGILKIDENTIYNFTDRGDIYVNLYFV